MLSTTSSPIVRLTGLILFLLLTTIYLWRIHNEDEQAILDDTALSDSRTAPSLAVHDVDEYTKSTNGGHSAGRYSIGDESPTTLHIHEHGRSSHPLEEDEDNDFEARSRTSNIGTKQKEEKPLKYHTKVFESPRGSGGQLGLKKGEVVPGHRKSYGTPVETRSPGDIKPGQKRVYYA